MRVLPQGVRVRCSASENVARGDDIVAERSCTRVVTRQRGLDQMELGQTRRITAVSFSHDWCNERAVSATTSTLSKRTSADVLSGSELALYCQNCGQRRHSR